MDDHTPTELWLRNPAAYIRQCHEVGVEKICWDHGLLTKRAIDPHRFMDLYYGNSPWKALIVSDWGAITIDKNHSMEKPEYCFPIWKYGESLDYLQKLIDEPVNDNPRLRRNIPSNFQYKHGQPHRIVLTYLPLLSTREGKNFIHYVADLQQEHPEVSLHIHGLYSFASMFGLPFKIVDFEAKTRAQFRGIFLPNGRQLCYDDPEVEQFEPWINLLGYKISDLSNHKMVCKFNIESAMWAAEHYKDAFTFKKPKYEELPSLEIERKPRKRKPQTNNRIFLKNVKPRLEDKFYCETCSLKFSCKYYREGAVCIVPDSEPVSLSRFFGTRDSQSILNGMQFLLQLEAERVEEARVAEVESERIHPEVTKMIDKVFNHAEQLAKLVDPNLRPGSGNAAKGDTTNNVAILGGSPQELASVVMNMLHAKGVPPDLITEDVIMELVAENGSVEENVARVATELRTRK